MEFVKHCPPMISDMEVGAATTKYMKELLGDGAVPMSAIAPGNKVSGGSEDFAFISNETKKAMHTLSTIRRPTSTMRFSMRGRLPMFMWPPAGWKSTNKGF